MRSKIIEIISISWFLMGCSNVASTKPTKEVKVKEEISVESSKESDISPACRSKALAPLMVCGEYVIVKGKLNSSNNLERLNIGTMYISEFLNKKENRGLIDKNVLLSGKCNSEVIGGFSTMVYLNDAKLLQVIGEEGIKKSTIQHECKELKERSKSLDMFSK